MSEPCRCVVEGVYCPEGLRLAAEASRWNDRAERQGTVENENAFVTAYRAVQWHLHDANDALFRVEGRRREFGAKAVLNLSFPVSREEA